MRHMTVDRNGKLAGVWTPDMVEQRLRSAMTTLRRLPGVRRGGAAVATLKSEIENALTP